MSRIPRILQKPLTVLKPHLTQYFNQLPPELQKKLIVYCFPSDLERRSLHNIFRMRNMHWMSPTASGVELAAKKTLTNCFLELELTMNNSSLKAAEEQYEFNKNVDICLGTIALMITYFIFFGS